ncbi:MAG: hypothetical protein ABEJ28_12480 [Salinigranum sp.]
MTTVMCTGCGEFVPASRRDGELLPVGEECPHCGGREFRQVGERE